ncbi:beta-ketoacyl synthase N-terminal-like domain-containing protein [Paraburkholderia terricola]|uniref:3-oxoacyl-(Acyl-carrier-protein) synthase n=1 Tax=Paraburkholderia terricola TaxID=169427 RepID=A0ABU1M1D8_9BURK|nr:beta-ketoacyl synthase N-terminal-like domain-containing protein [Paraburkholderia terricola]MDR6412838.1 3-oxoacyl-(acyl-carrier-protein) synthase [Paraburkholderia terricola]MDR6450046.1 3-oxoacyl-(acyl-carrier-protein) synthase [Paraburkholderia terricola]MDR6484890.1 3-oxoacyl-(acyl-carrier-protein) synthase [Paraburkholderia terricola]
MNDDPLVITAMGAVGCFGDDVSSLWTKLLRAETLARSIEDSDDIHLSTRMQDFDLTRFHKSADGHRRPKSSQYAMAAAVQVIEQAKLGRDHDVDRDEVAIVYGTGTGSVSLTEKMLTSLIEQGMGSIEPLLFQESVFNAPASWVGIEYGFRGPLVALPMGWPTGGHAVATAADFVDFGTARIAIVLLADELSPIAFKAFRALGLLEPAASDEQGMRPFDVRSRGAILGDGAAAIVVERASSARARGVPALAKLSGWSVTSDPFGMGPKGSVTSTLGQSMQAALAQAGRASVPVVFSGAYGSQDAAAAEAAGIRSLPGEERPIVTNIRGVVGEARGTTGLWNVIAAVQAMRHGQVPAIANCGEPDHGLGLQLATGASAPAPIDAALCNAFWLNGVNTSIVVEAA